MCLQSRRARIALLSLLLLVACTRRGAAGPTGAVQVDLVEVQPQPAQVGQATLVLRLTDAAGAPVEGAQVEVKGDMTHPGMVPALAEARDLGGGLYEVPFEWTMAGDWVLTVSGTLPDGPVFETQFQISVGAP